MELPGGNAQPQLEHYHRQPTRRDLRRHLHKNPSLQARLDEFVADVYEDAVYKASLETGMDSDEFEKTTCPWTTPCRLWMRSLNRDD